MIIYRIILKTISIRCKSLNYATLLYRLRIPEKGNIFLMLKNIAVIGDVNGSLALEVNYMFYLKGV